MLPHHVVPVLLGTAAALFQLALSNSSSSFVQAADVIGGGAEEEVGRALADWIRSGGGFVDERQSYRRVDPFNPDATLRGVFADAPIREGELLLRIPWSRVIVGDGADDAQEYACATFAAVRRELALGPSESRFGPYVEILLGTELSMPDVWGEDDLGLLTRLLGSDLAEQQGLVNWHKRWLKEFCGIDVASDPLGAKAGRLTLSRAAGIPFVDPTTPDATLPAMVPFWDLYNHRNGEWTNVEQRAAKLGRAFEVFAIRDIEKGEQIYFPYGKKKTTPEIFRDYGFVEQMPQIWSFDLADGEAMSFELYQIPGKPIERELGINLLRRPSQDTYASIVHLKSLLDANEANERKNSSRVRYGEESFDRLAWQYFGALKRAVGYASMAAKQYVKGGDEL